MGLSIVCRFAINTIAILSATQVDLLQEYAPSCTASSCYGEDLEEIEFSSLLQTSLEVLHEPVKRATSPQTPPVKAEVARPFDATKLPSALLVLETSSTVTHPDATTQETAAKESTNNASPPLTDQSLSSGVLSRISAAFGANSSLVDSLSDQWTSFIGCLWGAQKGNRRALALTLDSSVSSQRVGGASWAVVIIVIVVVFLLVALIMGNFDIDWSNEKPLMYGQRGPQRVGMGQSFTPLPVKRNDSGYGGGAPPPSLGPASQQSIGAPYYTRSSPGPTPSGTPVVTSVTPARLPPSQGNSTLGTPMHPVTWPGATIAQQDVRSENSSLRSPQPAPISSIPHICPALILPGNDSPLFSVPVYTIAQLQSGGGNEAIEILGPSGRPLLHARCPRTSSSAAVNRETSDGPWLELSTTPKSRHPHAIIGPLSELSGSQQQSVAIYGPGASLYGSMDMLKGVFRVNYRGMPVFSISGPGSGYLLNAYSPDGQNIASIVQKNELGVDSLVLQVNPGHDALLNLLCMLSILISSKEFR